MQYELQDSLGLQDARKCNKEFGASIELDAALLKKGAVVELPKASADYLTKRFKSLLKPVSKVVGQAKDADVKAPAK